jgi:hypothetical protein
MAEQQFTSRVYQAIKRREYETFIGLIGSDEGKVLKTANPRYFYVLERQMSNVVTDELKKEIPKYSNQYSAEQIQIVVSSLRLKAKITLLESLRHEKYSTATKNAIIADVFNQPKFDNQ